MTATQALYEDAIEVRSLLSKRENWTKGGDYVPYISGDQRFEARCLRGAIYRAIEGREVAYDPSVFRLVRSSAPNGLERYIGMMELLSKIVGAHPVSWNDRPETTHADVVAALDVAIRIAHERHEKANACIHDSRPYRDQGVDAVVPQPAHQSSGHTPGQQAPAGVDEAGSVVSQGQWHYFGDPSAAYLTGYPVLLSTP